MDYLEDDNLDQMTASLGVMKRWMDLEPFNSGNFKFSDNYSDSYSEALLGCNHLQVTIWTNKRMQAKLKQAEATLGFYN